MWQVVPGASLGRLIGLNRCWFHQRKPQPDERSDVTWEGECWMLSDTGKGWQPLQFRAIGVAPENTPQAWPPGGLAETADAQNIGRQLGKGLHFGAGFQTQQG
jgi:hypothetical protein